ncbi:hypothetical protein CR513_59557, partial [Mucuna pruriens]
MSTSSSFEVSVFPFLSSLEREPKPSYYRQWVDEEVLFQASFYSSPLISHYISEKTWCEAKYASHFQVVACFPIDRVCHPPFHGEHDFTYMYEPVFRLLGVTLPFYHFEAKVLWVLRLAPSQLHPSGWAVIQAFRLICRFFRVVPTASLLPYFYQSNASTPASWVRLVSRTVRDLFSEYNLPSHAFRPWFFKVYASERRLFATIAKSFPLHWQHVPSVDKVLILSQEDQTWVPFLEALPRGMDYATLVRMAPNLDAMTRFKDYLRDQKFNFRPILAQAKMLMCARADALARNEALPRVNLGDFDHTPPLRIAPVSVCTKMLRETASHPEVETYPINPSLPPVPFGPLGSGSACAANADPSALLPPGFPCTRDCQFLSSFGLVAFLDMMMSQHAQFFAALYAWKSEILDWDHLKSQQARDSSEIARLTQELRDAKHSLASLRSEITSNGTRNTLLLQELDSIRADRDALRLTLAHREGDWAAEKAYSTKLSEALDQANEDRNEAECQVTIVELDMSEAQARADALLSELVANEELLAKARDADFV